uniref:DPPIV_N domain-containing protein n=1 Tax=Echinostoma caproni TaxID=27848 RepID=A0A183B5M1_9TREM
LFEFHRLLQLHRYTIAPHGSDALHPLLNALGPAPKAYQDPQIDTAADQTDQNVLTTNDDKSLVTGHNRTSFIAHNETVQSIEKGKSRSSTEHSLIYSVRGSQSLAEINSHDFSSTQSWKNEVPKLFGRTIHCIYRFNWPLPFDSTTMEYVISGSKELTLPLMPSHPSVVAQARLYAALAPRLGASDCMILPMRPCHQPVLKDEAKTACHFCTFTNSTDLYNLTASLSFDPFFRDIRAPGQPTGDTVSPTVPASGKLQRSASTMCCWQDEQSDHASFWVVD